MLFSKRQKIPNLKRDYSEHELVLIANLTDISLEHGFRFSRFPALLEKVFERETEIERRRYLWAGILVALLFYNFFLIADYHILSDVFQTALIIRSGILTPLMLIFGILILRGLPAIPRETGIAILVFLIGATLIYFMNISSNPNKIAYYPAIFLIITFGNVVLLLRFWYGLAASITLLVLYIGFYPDLATLPPEVRLANIILFSTCIFVTMYANYVLEHELRRGYLLFLRDRIRRGELKSQNKKLAEISFIDPLTKLANRREVDNYLLQISEEPRPGSLAIIMIDVDKFKDFNDFYGHPAGDKCLRRLASVLRNTVKRKEDTVGRFGGEEFIILLPDTDLSNAISVAERIRQNIEKCSIPNEKSSVSNIVTISAGVSAGFIRTFSDVQTILAEADAALYRAKESGRNNVNH